CAQAHRMVSAGPVGRRGLPAGNESHRNRGRASRGRVCLFRATCRDRRASALCKSGPRGNGSQGESRSMSRNNELHDAVKRSLERYFKDMDGEKPTSIYDMVLKNVEKPMIELVLRQAEGNLTQAATML